VDREIERLATPYDNNPDDEDDPRLIPLREKVITGLGKIGIPAGSGSEKRYVERAVRNWLIDERRKMDTQQRRRDHERRRKAKAARYEIQRYEYISVIRRLVAMLHPELVPYLEKFFGEKQLIDIQHAKGVSASTAGRLYRQLKELLTGNQWSQDFPDRVQRAIQEEAELMHYLSGEDSEKSSPDPDETYDD
jgi:hypothetical protein